LYRKSSQTRKQKEPKNTTIHDYLDERNAKGEKEDQEKTPLKLPYLPLESPTTNA